MTDTPIALIDVLVCTYRRPELLLKTLDGIARCAAMVDSVRIIVVDNDHQQSAREVIHQWSQRSSIPVQYLSQPVQNISLTRNMALEHVTAPWIAMIDDDEVPDPNWLFALLAAAMQFEADVVFGPVVSEFDSDAPEWATQGTVFQRKRFTSGTSMVINQMRNGNVLLRASRLGREEFRFEPLLGLSGGEDSELFARMYVAKYRMVWCDEACVREWTPPARTTLRWVLTRAFRIGSVDAFNRRRFHRMAALMVGFLKASVFVCQGIVQTIFWAPLSTTKCVLALRRAALGAGFWYGLFAGPFLEYRSVEIHADQF